MKFENIFLIPQVSIQVIHTFASLNGKNFAMLGTTPWGGENVWLDFLHGEGLTRVEK
jgi:hypothetical protein